MKVRMKIDRKKAVVVKVHGRLTVGKTVVEKTEQELLLSEFPPYTTEEKKVREKKVKKEK